jgi:hemolysin III
VARPPGQEERTAIAKNQEKFSIARFSGLALLQYALLLLGFRLVLPNVWARQLAAGVPALLMSFLGMHLFLCFFEWAFHRYVLHAITIRGLRWFANGHRSHHGLTPIKLQAATAGSDRYILNRYPIVEEVQHQDSAFPWYAIVGFWVFFTPVLVGVQFLLPRAPILMGGYAAITFSMCLYEILHAIEHWPYEWWKRATEHPRFGDFWRRLYGFHHMHHANISCNEGISGFFGLPIADWVFGTYHQPRELLIEGRVATARDFAVTPPPRWVQWLDAWVRKREAKIHHGLR